MRIQYNLDERRVTNAEIDLDDDAELAYDMAETDDERRAVIEATIVRDARARDDWVYGRAIEFGIE